MTRNEWIALGIDRGFCGPPVCSSHDGVPTSFDEDQEMDDGYDPCITVIRPYADDSERREIENNHPASLWRKSGWTTEVTR